MFNMTVHSAFLRALIDWIGVKVNLYGQPLFQLHAQHSCTAEGKAFLPISTHASSTCQEKKNSNVAIRGNKLGHNLPVITTLVISLVSRTKARERL